jgi:hypothetical protein
MDAVRIFARYQHALDPATEVPAEALRSRRYRPKEPNVFSEAEIAALLAAADTLSPRFKALTWRTLIGLLAATGMRPGEACHLTVSDIDLTNGVIEVLQTKFGKSRLVFIHPTTATRGGPLPAGPSGMGRHGRASLPHRVRQQPTQGAQSGHLGRYLQSDRRRCRSDYRARPQASPAVESVRGAVPVLPRARFPGPLAAPGVRVSTHRALHGSCRQAGLGIGQGVGILLPR